MNTRNNYFTWTVDLANNPFRVEGTERNDWYTLRIPLQDSSLFQRVGNPNFGQIEYIRLWLDGTEDTVFVHFADIQLTRNAWEAKPVLPENKIRDPETRFEVAVINTEEDSIYLSPPGVSGYYDRTTQTTEREQSLRLNFIQFAPGDTGICERIPFKAQDLTGYNKLEMFVHGDVDREQMLFFFRFGQDARNYYEYRSTIKQGWHTENHVNIAFDEMTQVKLKLYDLQAEDPTVNEVIDGPYRVFGNPTLTRIKYYAIGIANVDSLETDTAQTGSIWVDELRTTNVRNNSGTAAMIAGSVALGDFASVQGAYSQQDEFFRTLTQADRRELGSGSRIVSYNYAVTMNLHKLLPQSLGASIPVNFNWSRSENTPRLITGSDIVVPDDRIAEQQSVSTNSGFSVNPRFSPRTNSPLAKYLLNNMSTSFSYRLSESRSPNFPMKKTESYTANSRYSLSVPRSKGLRIFSWMGGNAVGTETGNTDSVQPTAGTPCCVCRRKQKPR